MMSSRTIVNVSARLTEIAKRMPDSVAVAMPSGRHADGRRRYDTCTFHELDEDTNLLAAGLRAMGVRDGMRLVLMVRPGIDFIAITFAIFKAGAVVVLVDPGMGHSHLICCLEQVRPDGFIAIPLVHAVRVLLHHKFPAARYNVTVGHRWFWGGTTIDQLRATVSTDFEPAATYADTPAAVIFTTGSTGPPKGVGYRHGNFDTQVDQLQECYGIKAGEIDLPGFPLFALFNCAMGVTTVIPDMDPTRPARVNPQNIIEAVEDWQVTQAFGSPALWNVVAKYGEQHRVHLRSLRRVLSAGAPVPPRVLESMKAIIAPDGEVHTPYGATEALPVASISAAEVLRDTAEVSRAGAGTCVGHRFSAIQWKVIRISDEPIKDMAHAEALPIGEIGELIVTGPVVTDQYVTRTEANTTGKISDGSRIWHRMGDVGYLDQEGRFWFCGRQVHRIRTNKETLYTVPCEAVFNEHPRVYRSALVALGAPGAQTPVLIVQTHPGQQPNSLGERQQLFAELRDLARAHQHTCTIEQFLVHPDFPVDIRHNAKIFREKLAVWAARRLAQG